MAAPYPIREAVTADTAAMVAIERVSFGDPWSATSFAELLGPLSLIAEHEGKVSGYVVGRHAADEAEILDLAVRPDLRRQGIAGSLVDAVVARANALGLRRVYLEVRESNAAARALYQNHGFAEVGRRTGYYHAPDEDALVLARDIGIFSGSA